MVNLSPGMQDILTTRLTTPINTHFCVILCLGTNAYSQLCILLNIIKKNCFILKCVRFFCMCGIKINAQGLIINAFTMFKGEFYETCQEYAWIINLKKAF